MVATAANVQKEKSDSLEDNQVKRGNPVMGMTMQEKLDKDKDKDKDKSKDTGEVFRTALFGGPPVCTSCLDRPARFRPGPPGI